MRIIGLVLVVSLITFAGCSQDDDTKGPAYKANETGAQHSDSRPQQGERNVQLKEVLDNKT